jgi:hypothetical protein
MSSVIALGEPEGGVGVAPGAGLADVGVEAADVAPAAVVLGPPNLCKSSPG